ncbi:hypothetical protein [Oceanobacillus massiliensis]|uniref:hypothetical protein n=1 Tax=Oceanobacillus massiliensis TaxID=1465765 RepID=UPI0002891DF7|nr:hypothetical protein [Oceanobacillus massiliensis]
MKKMIPVALACFSILLVSGYLFLDTGSAAEESDEVNFENAKLIDSKVDEKSGVQIDVYTLEDKLAD